MNRVIGSSHDHLTAACDMRVIPLSAAGRGFFSGSRDSARNLQRQDLHRSKDLSGGPTNAFAGRPDVSDVVESHLKEVSEMKALMLLTFTLRKRRASSIIAKDRIACVIVSCALSLGMNRVIGS
jgi:hypothetical protein